RGKDPLEAGLLAELAPRRLERRLARLDLAADGQPGAEAPVMDDEDVATATGVDGDGEGAARRGHAGALLRGLGRGGRRGCRRAQDRRRADRIGEEAIELADVPGQGEDNDDGDRDVQAPGSLALGERSVVRT